jgi:hypothetical protein
VDCGRPAFETGDVEFLRVQGEGICEALWRALRYAKLGDVLDAAAYSGEANIRLILVNRIIEPYGVALDGVPSTLADRSGL